MAYIHLIGAMWSFQKHIENMRNIQRGRHWIQMVLWKSLGKVGVPADVCHEIEEFVGVYNFAENRDAWYTAAVQAAVTLLFN